MLRREIEDIGEWVGSLVVNSYFSITRNRSLAMIFLNPSLEPYDQYQSVLFEIEINTRCKCRPYADISHLSQYPDESEILFTISIQFRIIDSTYDYHEKLWTVKLKLMTDDGIKNEKYFEKRTLDPAVKLFCHAKHQCQIEKNWDEGLINYNSVLQIWLDNLHHTES
jgi:hypothetical protein